MSGYGGYISMISNGVSTSLSTGASWGSWAYGYLPGASVVADNVGAIWGGIGGIQKICEGYQNGNKTKMAVGTVMVLMSSMSFVPESWTAAAGETLGGFASLLPSLNYAMFEMPESVQAAIGYLAPAVPVAFNLALKRLAEDEPTMGDDGVASLFAILTAVANAYEQSPEHYLNILSKAKPELERLIPLWGVWRDKPEMIKFLETHAAECKNYVANVSNFALSDASIPVATAVGGQVIVNAPKSGKRRNRRRRRGRR